MEQPEPLPGHPRKHQKLEYPPDVMMEVRGLNDGSEETLCVKEAVLDIGSVVVIRI